MVESREGSRPRQHPRTAARVVDGRGLVVVIDQREVHTLNRVGTRVWELVDGRPLEAIVAAIVREFDVDEATAAADVDRFLGRMTRLGAIEWEANA